ncbi:MAG: NADH-quinone oxidoreductase subunit NuoK [Rhodobacter sp.]|nr:NADH-quinone oxidoreductase subunit NuoK [Rhodobacter sp.]
MILELMIALSVGAGLFGVGLYGALSQTNLVMIIMGVELILAAALVNVVAFWRYLRPDEPAAQMFALIIMVVMAVEMAVAFGVAIARFRSRGSVEMEEARELKG